MYAGAKRNTNQGCTTRTSCSHSACSPWLVRGSACALRWVHGGFTVFSNGSVVPLACFYLLQPLTTHLSCCCSIAAILLCLYCSVRLLTWVGCAVSTISTVCKHRQPAKASPYGCSSLLKYAAWSDVCKDTPLTGSKSANPTRQYNTTRCSSQQRCCSPSWLCLCSLLTQMPLHHPCSPLQPGCFAIPVSARMLPAWRHACTTAHLVCDFMVQVIRVHALCDQALKGLIT